MKITNVLVGMCVLAVSAITFCVGSKTPEKSSDLTLQNIDAVGVSASETTCKGPGDPCKIYEGGILVGEGHGDLIHIN